MGCDNKVAEDRNGAAACAKIPTLAKIGDDLSWVRKREHSDGIKIHSQPFNVRLLLQQCGGAPVGIGGQPLAAVRCRPLQ